MPPYYTLQYMMRSPAARAQVRADWRQAYAKLIPTIRGLKLEFKQAQRDKQPSCSLVLQLHAAKRSAAHLIAIRRDMKVSAREIRMSARIARFYGETPVVTHVPYLSDARVMELCEGFDIAVYQVGKVCGHILPEADNQKWFVSTTINDARLTDLASEVPLSWTETDARRAAVYFLRLEHISQEVGFRLAS